MQSEPLLGERPTAAATLKWRPPCSLRAKKCFDKAKVLIPILTSFGIGLRIRKCMQATLFFADPLLKARTIISFCRGHDYWWASFVFACAVLPLFLMYITMNATFRPDLVKKRSGAFKKTYGGAPTFTMILRVHAKMLWKILQNGVMVKETLNHQEATYAKLMLVLAVAEQFSFTVLSAYIFVRQYFLPDHVTVISPSTIFPASASAVLNIYLAIDFFASYSSICSGGDKVAYWCILASLGEGAAPPSLLIKLRTEHTVNGVMDMGNLNLGGVMSIFLAIESSSTLVQGTLPGKQINQFYTNHPDKDAAADVIRNGFTRACSNRGLLRRIACEPALQVPAYCFDGQDNALQLQEIRNGKQLIYSRDNKMPDTPLRRSLDANDFHHVADLVTRGYTPKFEHYQLAIELDLWQSLGVLLAHCPPSGPDLKDLFAFACGSDCPMVIEFLLFWATPAALANATGSSFTPLDMACDGGKAKNVKRLLQAKADPCMPGPFGKLPIHAACSADRDPSSIVQSLLDARASPTSCNPSWQNFTPLHHAACSNHPTTIQLLLKAGAARDAFDSLGSQPLHLAAASGSLEALRALLLARADPTTPAQHEGERKTALSFAREYGNAVCVEVLEAEMGVVNEEDDPDSKEGDDDEAVQEEKEEDERDAEAVPNAEQESDKAPAVQAAMATNQRQQMASAQSSMPAAGLLHGTMPAAGLGQGSLPAAGLVQGSMPAGHMPQAQPAMAQKRLVMRAEESLESKQIKHVPEGSMIEILQKGQGERIYVRDDCGQEGWVTAAAKGLQLVVLVEQEDSADKSDEPAEVVKSGTEYTITLDRTDGARLGIDVEKQDGVTLLIESINGGLVEKWNKDNPNQKVSPNDRIVEVNGVRDDLMLLVDECKKNMVLKIKLLHG
mmetsp:Transcript_51871/g.97317  ORF Transcript_51871/g.97317 Transcript_51871/m.97317 type:complete len:899 (+) Transcript_51871:38-2734(+)